MKETPIDRCPKPNQDEKMVLIVYLEVLDGLDAQLERGVLVADEERLRVLLKR